MAPLILGNPHSERQAFNFQSVRSQARWGVPKIRDTLLSVPILRTIVYWGLDWGTLILGNYQMGQKTLVVQGYVGLYRDT